MKTVARGIIIGLLSAASVASAAVPLIKVTVADSSGKAAYKGNTDREGTFATGKLQPGRYIVQFNCKSAPKGSKYALVVSAGKKKIIANAVEAEKFGEGGVAMRINVGSGLNITGQVVAAERAQVSSRTQTSSSFKERNIQELQQLRMAHQLEAAQSRSQ
jgi:hypothetical protein